MTHRPGPNPWRSIAELQETLKQIKRRVERPGAAVPSRPPGVRARRGVGDQRERA